MPNPAEKVDLHPVTVATLQPQRPPGDPGRSPARHYLSRLSPGSRRAQLHALSVVAGLVMGEGARPAGRGAVPNLSPMIDSVAAGRLERVEAIPWHKLRYRHVQAIRDALTSRGAPATANRTLAALRGILREAWRLGMMDAESYRRAVDVPTVKGARLPRGRALGHGELEALFHVCAAVAGPSGRRDAGILALLYGGGLRRAELVALDLGDLDLPAGTIRVRHGKGDKARECFLPPGSRDAVGAWIGTRGNTPGPVFCRILRGGRILPHARLTGTAIYVICRKRAAEAGVAPFSPHDCRRSYVSDLLDGGADLSLVAGLAGHSSTSTTTIYDRRPDAARRAAIARLRVPYGENSGPVMEPVLEPVPEE